MHNKETEFIDEFGAAFYLCKAVFTHKAHEDGKVFFSGDLYEGQEVSFNEMELYRSGFKIGDTVVCGYEYNGNSRIQFIIKASEVDTELLNGKLDGTTTHTEIEHYINSNYKVRYAIFEKDEDFDEEDEEDNK